LYRVLQEAAGTTSFLMRKEEALKQLAKAAADKREIADILDSLTERMQEIEAEKTSFEEYKNI
jgi:chromosome segregation ATPase